MENNQKITGPLWFQELEAKRRDRLAKMTDEEKEELRLAAERMADKAESSIGVNS